ncbi:helix-turn-helix transcriptional regulator [Paenibacillus sp. IHBB 3054]|uniref:helix-turn-helix transcriptional regulator n=1 Tax=Paenibacillus sp. IHBB 3054 TaxID=3425689 RepID=UPI003F681E2B
MNKTDRLLAIVLELQRNKVLRAEDLAATFETSVRTIYRDIQALSEAGVSVIGAPGQGYSLMEGYFLPPVSFTVEEAVTLLIGTDFIEQWFDVHYGRKSRTSRGKIEAILPEPVRSEAARIRKSIRLRTSAEDVSRIQEKAYLEAIRQAILEERKISFHYSKKIAEADGNRQSVRTVAPYGLVLLHGAWVLNLEAYRPPDDRNIRVRIRVQPDIADKVRESNNFYIDTIEEQPEGLLVTFRVRQAEELLQSVLGWGAGVVVLEPESFRYRVKDELENMLKRY